MEMTETFRKNKTSSLKAAPSSHVTEPFFTLPGTMLPRVPSQTQGLGREMGEAECRAGPEPLERRALGPGSLQWQDSL